MAAGTVWPVDAVAGAPSYTGRMLRNASVSPQVGGATTARPLGGFSGIRPGTPSSIVTATSTTWTVTPFAGTIDGEAAAIAGVYNYAFNTNQTGSVTAAAGSARIDRLDLQVSDPAEGDGTGTPGIAVVYTAGTAGSGVPNAAPARSHPLCLINVPASGGGSPSVTFNASFTAAAGGILPVPTTVYPASPYLGQYVDDAVLGLMRYNGTAWINVVGDTGWVTPTLQNSWVNFGAPYRNCQYRRLNGVVYVAGLLKSGTTTAGTVLFNLPAGFRPSATLFFGTQSASALATVNLAANGDLSLSSGASAASLSTDFSFPAEA